MTDPEESWLAELAELRAYIAARHRFPSSSKPGQKILAGWWSRQTKLRQHGQLTAGQEKAMKELSRFALSFRDAERTGRTHAGIAQDVRDVTVFRAREALAEHRRILSAVDKEVLQARVRYPRATVAEIAGHLRMSRSTFRGRITRALNRVDRQR